MPTVPTPLNVREPRTVADVLVLALRATRALERCVKAGDTDALRALTLLDSITTQRTRAAVAYTVTGGKSWHTIAAVAGFPTPAAAQQRYELDAADEWAAAVERAQNDRAAWPPGRPRRRQAARADAVAVSTPGGEGGGPAADQR